MSYELAVQPCWLDNMQVLYFPNNNSYANQTGVSIRPHDFGGLNVRRRRVETVVR